MKKAIIYARVSTDEQAEKGYSRGEQLNRMQRFCATENINIAAEFLEDHSAKTFNRPEFNKLLQLLKTKKLQADTLIITKIDRFTRNLFDAFNVVKDLEKLGVQVYSLAEGLLDYNNPHKFFPLVVQTSAAQYDNMLRSDNVKRGMRQAMQKGRFMSTPPKGYLRDKVTKLLFINKPIADIVIWSFNKYAKGVYSSEEVRREAVQKGLKLNKQSFINMLKNPIYIGKILIHKTKEEPEQIVNGLHEALVSEEIFYTVQQVLSGKRKPYKKPKHETNYALPLRGHLVCPECARILSGSITQNRPNGNAIPYYHCQQNKYGCKHRVNANNAHSILKDYLKTLQQPEEVVELSERVLADIFNINDSERLNGLKAIEAEINVIDARISKVTNDYADGNLPIIAFNNIVSKFEQQKNDLIMQHAIFVKTPANFDRYISYSLGLLKDLSYYYAEAEPEIKNKLIGVVFPEKLTFLNNWYNTTKTNEAYSITCNVSKDSKENSPTKIVRLYSQAPPSGLEPETL